MYAVKRVGQRKVCRKILFFGKKLFLKKLILKLVLSSTQICNRSTLAFFWLKLTLRLPMAIIYILGQKIRGSLGVKGIQCFANFSKLSKFSIK